MKEGNQDEQKRQKEQASNRRHFLRCSGGATAGTMLAWQLMTSPSQAGGNSGGSGASGGSGSIPVGGSGGSGT